MITIFDRVPPKIILLQHHANSSARIFTDLYESK